MYDIELPYFAILWPSVTLCGLVGPYVALCGLMWPCVALCGLIWSHMVFYGRISSFLAVIDPNSFGLVLITGTFPFNFDHF